MGTKLGTKRPDLVKRNKAAAKAGTKAIKKTDVDIINKTAKNAEKIVINELARDAGINPNLIWTRKQFVELIRKSIDLAKFGQAIEASVSNLQINENPTVSLGLVKTALEYSVQKAPIDDKDTTGLPPITIIVPSEK